MIDVFSNIAGTASVIALIVSIGSVIKAWFSSKKDIRELNNIRFQIKQTDSDIINAIENISLSISNSQELEINKNELKSAIEHLERSLADIRILSSHQSPKIKAIENSIERLKPLTIDFGEELGGNISSSNSKKVGGET